MPEKTKAEKKAEYGDITDALKQLKTASTYAATANIVTKETFAAEEAKQFFRYLALEYLAPKDAVLVLSLWGLITPESESMTAISRRKLYAEISGDARKVGALYPAFDKAIDTLGKVIHENKNTPKGIFSIREKSINYDYEKKLVELGVFQAYKEEVKEEKGTPETPDPVSSNEPSSTIPEPPSIKEAEELLTTLPVLPVKRRFKLETIITVSLVVVAIVTILIIWLFGQAHENDVKAYRDQYETVMATTNYEGVSEEELLNQLREDHEAVVSEAMKLEEIKKKASENDPEALYLLGSYYYTQADFEKAEQYFISASKLGVTEAKIFLSYLHYKGLTTTLTDEEAFNVTREAADSGDKYGCYYLALYYKKGIGTKESEKDAAVYYDKAASAGIVSAKVRLGMLLSDSSGEADDTDRALILFEEAYREGDGLAAMCIAAMYQYGIGLPKSSDTAAKWYQLAYDKGWTEAKKHLEELEEAP